jgi:hypothetical protein
MCVCVCVNLASIYALRRNGTVNVGVNLTCELFQIVTVFVVSLVLNTTCNEAVFNGMMFR